MMAVPLKNLVIPSSSPTAPVSLPEMAPGDHSDATTEVVVHLRFCQLVLSILLPLFVFGCQRTHCLNLLTHRFGLRGDHTESRAHFADLLRQSDDDIRKRILDLAGIGNEYALTV